MGCVQILMHATFGSGPMLRCRLPVSANEVGFPRIIHALNPNHYRRNLRCQQHGKLRAGLHQGSSAGPQVSQRVLSTDAPCIVKTKRLVAGTPGVLSLAQGIVHWPPPPAALEVVQDKMLSLPAVHGYGPAEGIPRLREALTSKIQRVNGLHNYRVMVTSGANQAFTNIVLTLLDASDRAVLFKPYYFNHLMAFQMTGGAANVVFGACDPLTLHPDLDWLEAEMSQPSPPKLVVLVNPCNPTGVLMSQAEVQRASDICAAAGSWLVLDNTYEDFVYGPGAAHHCVAAPHVLNVFSFSKAYGMMGWRVGYIAYPDFEGDDALGQQLLKVQDTIPICPTTFSQELALAALQEGGDYIRSQIRGLSGNRQALIDALSPLGSLGHGVAGGEGAIYFWAKLPPGCEDDEAVVAWLVREAGVCVIPGSACGSPGHIRAAYANLQPELCQQAAGRLKSGLQRLVDGGPAVLEVRRAAAAAVAGSR